MSCSNPVMSISKSVLAHTSSVMGSSVGSRRGGGAADGFGESIEAA
jgi:hypothetical protein